MRIRACAPDDLEALYAISLATGDRGGDASALYRDPRLMGAVYAAPYALLEPELAFVAEDAKGVAGFAVGTCDTRAFEDRLEAEWRPRLRAGTTPPDPARADRWTADERRLHQIHNPTPTPDWVVAAHPAHLHVNLLPRLQGLGVGARLVDRWAAAAAARGVRALHAGVNAENARALGFWRRQGFAEIDPARREGRTVWLGRAVAR